MTIKFDHRQNLYTVEGPKAALPRLLEGYRIDSMLDVGCGIGTWLHAAKKLGISEVFGVDGVQPPKDRMLIPEQSFREHDFRKQLNLARTFDAVLCLEVAEHIQAAYSDALIKTLTQHGDFILFSAACPGQGGQHHVNCQWPAYWQAKFNKFGFVCDDSMRWTIWEDARIEWWYRQNLFSAKRNAQVAGTERRIKAVLHPEFFGSAVAGSLGVTERIERGSMPAWWYFTVLPRAAFHKIWRRIRLKRYDSPAHPPI